MTDDLLRLLAVPRSPIAPERVRELLKDARPLTEQAQELVRAGMKRGQLSEKPPCTPQELDARKLDGLPFRC